MISVVMPLFNAERFLSETIESVISQTYTEWELIIVDDVSTDKSLEIAEKYASVDSRIKVLRLKSNSGGPARPRNIGIENANGEYIALLDADDVWLPHKLEKQLEFLKKNKKSFTSCQAIEIDESSKIVNGSFFKKLRMQFKKRETLKDLIKSNFIITSSVLIKKENIFSFDENKNFVAVEDLCVWLKIFERHENIYLFQNEVLLKYRVLDDSISERTKTGRQDAKMYLCLFSFLVEQNRSELIEVLKSSICKSRMFTNMKSIFR